MFATTEALPVDDRTIVDRKNAIEQTARSPKPDQIQSGAGSCFTEDGFVPAYAGAKASLSTGLSSGEAHRK